MNGVFLIIVIAHFKLQFNLITLNAPCCLCNQPLRAHQRLLASVQHFKTLNLKKKEVKISDIFN